MEIILLQRVAKLGNVGQVVKVKPGYARNYLIPHKKAVKSNKDNLAWFEAQKSVIEAQNLKAKAEAEFVASKLGDCQLALVRQASDMGHLYGSVTAKDIAESLLEKGVNVNAKQIIIGNPIKEVGVYIVVADLHADVQVDIKVAVAQSVVEAEKLLVEPESKVEEPVVPAADEEYKINSADTGPETVNSSLDG